MFSDYANPKMPKYTNAEVSAVCKAIDLDDENVLLAIVHVESSGRGYQANGKLKMLFEPHLFYAALRSDPAKLSAAVNAGVAYQHWGERPYPADSYARLTAALAIDETSALCSASWGLAQILGSNHKACGYSTVQSMVSDFASGEASQLAGMAEFLRSAGLGAAMADKDWKKIALGYNGPGYAANHYDEKLEAAYKALPPFVPAALGVPAPIAYAKPTIIDVTANAVQATTAGSGQPLAGVTVTLGHPEENLPSVSPAALPLAPVTDTGITLYVQKQLKALGYAGVGTPDGNAADWTEAAILDFRNSHNKAFPNQPPIPLVPTIDSDLVLALAQGPAKSISEARATATPSSPLVANLPATIAAGKNKLVAAIVGIPAALGSLIEGTLNTIPDARTKLEPLHDLAGSVPAWAWPIAAVIVAAIVWINAHGTQEAQAAAVRKGTTV